MIEHIESLLVPSVYNKIRKSTNDIWEHAKTLPVELFDSVIESDGLYFKFENVNGELQLRHTFMNDVTLKPGNEINALIPNAEKIAITRIVQTTNTPPSRAAIFDLTQGNTGDVITWVENHVQYWKCKSRPVLNRISKSLFLDYRKLTDVSSILSVLDTSNVIDMQSMFSRCEALPSLDLSMFNTSKVIDMSSMFSGCNATINYGTHFTNTSMQNLSEVGETNKTFNMFLSSTSNKPSWDSSYYYWSSTGQFVISSGLLPGSSIQSAINGNATRFVKSTSQPANTITTTNISTENGVAVTWYDATTTTQYWWSKYEVMFMNPDGSNMFSFHRSLTNISLVGFSGRYALDLRYLFDTCTNLQRIDGLELLEAPIVTSIDSMFYDCNSLVSIQFSDKFDTSRATSMWNMFYGCESLTTLDVSMFKTGNMTSMNQTFANCFNLTSLDLSSFDTSNVTGMGAMFYTCRSLTTLILSSKFKTGKSTSFSSMFCGCTKLTSLDMSSFNTSSVTYMDNMFKECTSLFILDLSMFDTTKVTTMEGMFYKCVINGLDISTFNTVNVTNMKQMFYDTPNVLNIGFGPNFVFTAMPHLTSPDSINNTYQMMYNCTASGPGPWLSQGKFDSTGTFTLGPTTLANGETINSAIDTNATSFIRSTTPPDTGGGV